jgi:hypothetical protein
MQLGKKVVSLPCFHPGSEIHWDQMTSHAYFLLDKRDKASCWADSDFGYSLLSSNFSNQG